LPHPGRAAPGEAIAAAGFADIQIAHFKVLRFPPPENERPIALAQRAFMETGYHGATMRFIAGLAQISVPGLYHHYASKQDLLVRILDLTMSELLWRVQAARDEGRDNVERVALIVECLALFHTHRRELAFLGASEMRSIEPVNRRRIAALRTDSQRIMDVEIAGFCRDKAWRREALLIK